MLSTILALDASVNQTAACLLLGDAALHLGLGAARPRSADLAGVLGGLLERAGVGWDELDGFALGAGPGSFTGLRIAAATLAGFNAGRGKPVIHLSSLAITACEVDTDADLTVIEDARAGEAFVGLYRQGKAQDADRCVAWDEVAAMAPAPWTGHSKPAIRLENWSFIPACRSRDAALERCLRRSLENLPETADLPRYPQPVYLQASQAERNAHV